MKKGIIGICLLAIVAGSGYVFAADDAVEGDLGIDASVSWFSKYIWRGIDRFDDKAVWQPSVNLDLWDTGFHANVWAAYPAASGVENATEYNYTFGYGNTINEAEASQIDYSIDWRYYDFIDQPSNAADLQEIVLGVSFPNICESGIVPSYAAIKMWNSESGSVSRNASGWIHYFRLDYPWAVPGFIENNPEQVFNLFADITYNGSAGAVAGAHSVANLDTTSATAPDGVDHDWSHATFGVTTDIEVAELGGTITPGVFYQISMDESVNNENELWTGVSYTMSF